MKNAVFFVAIFALTSCANSRFIQTGFNSQPLPPLSKDAPVSIITEIPKNASKVIELGICKGTAPGGGIISDRTHKAIDQLKKCARENGGNAIMLGSNDEGGVFTDMGYSQQVAKAQGKVYYIEVNNN